MFSLLFAIAAGYALGMFVTGKWRPFMLCLPASAAAYLVIKVVLTAFTSKGIQLPSIGMFVMVSLVQAPLLMLGVYWARRKQKRNGY